MMPSQREIVSYVSLVMQKHPPFTSDNVDAAKWILSLRVRRRSKIIKAEHRKAAQALLDVATIVRGPDRKGVDGASVSFLLHLGKKRLIDSDMAAVILALRTDCNRDVVRYLLGGLAWEDTGHSALLSYDALDAEAARSILSRRGISLVWDPQFGPVSTPPTLKIDDMCRLAEERFTGWFTAKRPTQSITAGYPIAGLPRILAPQRSKLLPPKKRASTFSMASLLAALPFHSPNPVQALPHQQSRLFNLPPEIRNTIYELSLPSGKEIFVLPPIDGDQATSIDVARRCEPGLLQTCSRIRHEAQGIFYASNVFHIAIPPLISNRITIDNALAYADVVLRYAKSFKVMSRYHYVHQHGSSARRESAIVVVSLSQDETNVAYAAVEVFLEIQRGCCADSAARSKEVRSGYDNILECARKAAMRVSGRVMMEPVRDIKMIVVERRPVHSVLDSDEASLL